PVGGVYPFAWSDSRYALQTGVFAQAITAAGDFLWDDAERPLLVSAEAAPGHQGGIAIASWDASIADHPSAAEVVSYRVWRALPEAPAFAPASNGEGSTFVHGGRTVLWPARQVCGGGGGR